MPSYESMTLRGQGGGLPRYQGRGGTYAPGAGVGARVSDAAAGIAAGAQQNRSAAMGRLGAALAGAADQGLKAYDDYARSKATELITRYRTSMNEALYGEGGILNAQGEDALNAGERWAEKSADLRESLTRDAQENVKYYFNLLADRDDEESGLKVRQHAATQQTVMLNRNDEAAAQERADSAVANYADPEAFSHCVGESLWYTEQYLRRNGYGDEALARGLKTVSSGIFRGSIEKALSAGDVTAAEHLLSQGWAGGEKGEGRYLSAQDATWATAAIRNEREAQAARAAAQAQRRALEEQRTFVDSTSASVLKQLESFPETASMAEKESAAIRLTSVIQDPEQRKLVRAVVLDSLGEQDLERKALVVEELGIIDRRFAGNASMTLAQKLEFIHKGPFQEETKKRAEEAVIARREGREDARASALNARRIRAQIDAAGGMDSKHVAALVLDAGLNEHDRDAMLSYPKTMARYSQARIDTLISSLCGKDTSDSMRAMLYTALMRDPDIASGAELNDQALKEKLYFLVTGAVPSYKLSPMASIPSHKTSGTAAAQEKQTRGTAASEKEKQ